MLNHTRAHQTPRPGDLIAEKYRVEAVIGKGGMGVVVAARHLLLGSRVAIKVLTIGEAVLQGAVERFVREAQIAAALQHENVVRVLDLGVTPGPAPYLVMEHLEGEDLRTRARRGGLRTIADVLTHVLQACEAVSAAHEKGILHRDIKSANLFVTARSDGRPLVKLLDFGLARWRDAPPEAANEGATTQASLIVGSPHYMSPEQAQSLRNADVRSDIWSLGVVLYELLSRTRPFRGEGPAGIMASVILEEPTPIRFARPDLPLPLAEIVMRCLRKSPAQRPQSVRELMSALAPFAADPRGAVGEGAAGGAAKADEVTQVILLKPQDVKRSPARKASLWIARASVALAMLAGGIALGALPAGANGDHEEMDVFASGEEVRREVDVPTVLIFAPSHPVEEPSLSR